MSHFALSALVTSATTFILAFFIIKRDPKNVLFRVFASYSACISAWSFLVFIHGQSENEHLSLIAAHLLHVPAGFIPVLFIHFVYVFLEKRRANFHRIWLIISYAIGVLFVPLAGTESFVAGVVSKYGIRNLMVPGSDGMYYIFMAFFGLNVLCGLSRLCTAFMAAEGKGRNQLRYLIIGSIIGYAGGIDNFLIVHDIKVFPLYPYGSYFVALYVAMTFYSIVKYQFLRIEVIVKKTLVFAGLFGAVYVVIALFTFLGQDFLQVFTGGDRWLALIPSIMVIVLIYRPLETFLISVTDKYLFQKKYDYKHYLRQFMEEIRSMVFNANDIAESTLDFLGATLKPDSSAIYMNNKLTDTYDLLASRDMKSPTRSLSQDMNLIEILKAEGKVIQIGSRNNISLTGEETNLQNDSELLIPMTVHNELLGILCVGKKKSDEEYTHEDLEVLVDLSRALSIALNNAELFDEKADAEKRAMIGTLATGINHEIGNPLNVISVKLHMFNIMAKKGLLNDKTKEDIIEDVVKINDVCLDGAKRISEITKKISNFAKPDKNLALESVKVDEVIDEVVSMIGHYLSQEGVRIEKQIYDKDICILADRGQLKQIVFNLIKNGAQAARRPDGLIHVGVSNDSQRGEVMIEVCDNGCGISESALKKIFMPFYTTKEPGKGTGLGLALVKRLVEINHGRIDIQSQVGSGTRAKLIFQRSGHE